MKKGVDFDILGFPIFKGNDVKFTMRLEKDLYIKPDDTHFKEFTRMLKEVIEKGKIPKDIFTPKQLKEIKIGLPRISDLTWRHHQIPGKMQLVVSETHSVNHLGEISYGEAELDEKFRMEVCR